jgi:transcriptional regulator with XRE-family HTH domain
VLVKQLRTEKGWTEAELAKRARVSIQWLRALEGNRLKSNHRMQHEMQVISALGFGTYEIKDFIGRVEDMVKETLGPPPWLNPAQTETSERPSK